MSVQYRTNDQNAGAIPVDTQIATAYRDGYHHQSVTIFDDNLDAFSRLRTSQPTGLFDAQFTYDLQPLLFEQVTTTTDTTTITFDDTNRAAEFALASATDGSTAYMQSYEYIRYQPGKSQQVFVTFNMDGGVASVIKFAGLSNGTNGYEFRMNGTTAQFVILSTTSEGNQTAAQSAWNIDPMDGTGASGVTMDFSKQQILIIDFQALYAGRVRFGFDVGGRVVYAHEFNNANETTDNYIATANLPVRVGMSCTATASATMHFNCSSVISEGGQDDVGGYSFTAEGTGTAASGARAHILSLRPNTTLNSITNRTKFVLDSVDILVTGNWPIEWELCVGQAIGGTTTFTDVNATYSAMEFNTVGAISGTPTIVIASGYTAASAANKSVTSARIANRYPITLNAAGAVRSLGTLTLIATGIGGDSAMRVTFNWHEVR
jgi:hypothetical protein